MDQALEDIEFLALSANRVEVLTLVAKQRQTRGDLAAATGASQATLGRILGDFEERSWVERDDGGYVATATGRLVADGFSDLLTVVETEHRLRGIVEYVPTEALDFDLRRLSSATVTVPSGTRPNAPVQRVLGLVEEATEIRAFSHAFNEQSLETVERRVTEGGASFAGVFSRSAIEALADDSALRRRLRSLLEADGTSVHVCDREIPLAVTLADDVVHLLVRDADGIIRASVDTDDSAVHEWASGRFEAYREGATPLDETTLEE